MQYRSTRDHKAVPSLLSFEQALFMGLAPDGGLYIPTYIPSVPKETLAAWKYLSFVDLAHAIFRLYVDIKEIDDLCLHRILASSFATFTNEQVTPISKLGSDLYLLELFHGPTYAFKDVALQVVGNMFEYFLEKSNNNGEKRHINVLGATSGDTGGAAIYGLRGKKNVNVFILFPKGRVSNVQEAQMTSVPDSNVFNVSVEGTFDNCQEVVKSLFCDVEFREKYNLAAVNSINWARILSQTVYYFYSFFKMQEMEPGSKIQYSVPTGNFGDVLAGYFAYRMNLPISKLIVATNENNILTRFFESGTYQKTDHCIATLSPAMDILASSNFERLLWYLEVEGSDQVEASSRVIQHMSDLKGPCAGFSVDMAVLERAQRIFGSSSVDDKETSSCIGKYYRRTQSVLLDPHTAVGLVAADRLAKNGVATVCLSTAHPGKFPDAVLEAVNGLQESPVLSWEDFAPKPLVEAMEMPKRCDHIQTDGGQIMVAIAGVKKLMMNKLEM